MEIINCHVSNIQTEVNKNLMLCYGQTFCVLCVPLNIDQQATTEFCVPLRTAIQEGSEMCVITFCYAIR